MPRRASCRQKPAIRPPRMLNGKEEKLHRARKRIPARPTGTRRSDDEPRHDIEPPARGPDDPTDLTKRNWKALLKRTVKEFQDDNLTDWAAALTYYAILALFPALLVLVALLGIVGQAEHDRLAASTRCATAGLGSAADNIRGAARTTSSKPKGGAGALLGFGLLGAIWSASGLPRRVHARVERDLRGRGGPPVLEAAAAAGRADRSSMRARCSRSSLIGLVVSGPLAEADRRRDRPRRRRP